MFKPRFEFSWRAAFVGCYLTPERDRLWVCLIPFVPLYIRLRPAPPNKGEVTSQYDFRGNEVTNDAGDIHGTKPSKEGLTG